MAPHSNPLRTLIRGVVVASWAITAAPLASAQRTGQHPDPQYVDASIPVTHRLRLAGPRVAPPVVLGSEVLATIGQEHASDDFLFGEVSSVALTASGAIAVVDRRMENLRIFDATGRLLQRLGRRGQGPGEFRAPHTLYVTARNDIWVADMQRRLTEFTLSGEGYRLGRITPVDYGIRSLCRLDSQVIANAIVGGDANVLRVLDPAGKSLRAFGRVYQSPNAGLNYQYAEGKVACDAASGMIVYAPQAAIGEVRGFRADGQLLWRTVIDGLEHLAVTETQGGGILVGPGSKGAHSLVSLLAIPGAGVVLQYEYRTNAQLAANEPSSQVVTIFVNPATGAAMLSTAAWPRIAAVSGNRAVVVFEEPVPRLEVRDLRLRP